MRRLLLPLALAVTITVGAPNEAAGTAPGHTVGAPNEAAGIAVATRRETGAAAVGAARGGAVAAARRARCRKGTLRVGPRSAPRACLPKRLRLDSPDGLRSSLDAARRLPRGAKRSPAARRVARQALRFALQTGVPKLATRARGAQDGDGNPHQLNLVGEPTSLGVTQRMERRGDDRIVGEFEREDGIETRLDWRYDAQTGDAKEVIIEARNSRGAGATFGITKGPPPPDCPTAAGDVPARYLYGLTIGDSAVKHGKRTWRLIKSRVEGPWHGYVGAGAKAEKFDVSLRGELELRSGVEIAATGKALKRDPTRTFRTALDKRALPVRLESKTLAYDLRMRGPQGTRIRHEHIDSMTGLAVVTLMAVDDIDSALEQGDRHWYDARACAKLDFTWSPDKVTKGGRADWDLTVSAADGTEVADAVWTPHSNCGALTVSATRGPAVHFTVVDTAGSWGWTPYAPACAGAEITSTAGRPRTFGHTIDPVRPQGLKVAIRVLYSKHMTSQIAPTDAAGTGEVLLAPGVDYAEGTGSHSGREWDQTPDNTCGEDMLRTRNFAGTATVGAQRNGDGTITVGFTANDRPWELAWIVVVPETGGTKTITAAQPFCGEPGLARTRAEIAVTVTQVEMP